jgi:hypothetical protein
MITYCIEHKFEILDMGYSINRSLLRYKLKWGEAYCLPPPWNIVWKTKTD